MWFLLALDSAIFAALTSILAKIGIEGVGSNLATAIKYDGCCYHGMGNGIYLLINKPE